MTEDKFEPRLIGGALEFSGESEYPIENNIYTADVEQSIFCVFLNDIFFCTECILSLHRVSTSLISVSSRIA